MKGHIFSVIGTALALTTAVVPASGQVEASPRSTTTGLSVGLHASTASLFLVEDRSSTYGSGLGVSVGYGLGSHFAIHASTSGAVLKPSASESWLLGHVDLEGRFNFGDEASAWAPHLAIGVGARTANHDVFQEQGEVWHSSPGLTMGGGLSYFLNPAVSMDASVRYSFGNLRNMRCPDGEDVMTSCATSTRLNVGATWFPRAGTR